jgi:hypothetical protein
MLTEKIAEILYTADVQPVEWEQALDDDKTYYRRVADVVLDAVVSHLQSQPAGEIPFRAVGDYLQAEADIGRLRR